MSLRMAGKIGANEAHAVDVYIKDEQFYHENDRKIATDAISLVSNETDHSQGAQRRCRNSGKSKLTYL